MKVRKIVLLIIMVVVVSSAALHLVNYEYGTRSFDKELWDRYPEKRWKMLDSLTKDDKLIGLSRDEVIDLLGENGAFLEYQDIEYIISQGVCDPEGLLIYIDNNNVVYKCELIVH